VGRYRVGNSNMAYIACSDGRVLYQTFSGRIILYTKKNSAEEAKRVAQELAEGESRLARGFGLNVDV